MHRIHKSDIVLFSVFKNCTFCITKKKENSITCIKKPLAHHALNEAKENDA